MAAACPNCHQELPIPDAKFCPSCGQRIEAVEAEKLLKVVTVLFADVVSSTDRAEKMYPDEIKELMESFFAAITPEITAEGGFIDSFAGDAVMAIFGVPVAHEDDALRAVRAARRMIAATERWGADKPDLHKVRIRIGINTGDVLAAAGDATVRVTGDAVNVAARLESKAPVMQILIGERTARAVRKHFHLEDVGGLEMKGKSEPVPAFIVGEPKEIVEERGIPGLHSPLIGREHELKTMQDAFEEVIQRSEAKVVTVVADAGVGKSRLIREVFSSIGAEARTMSGRCLPYGDGVTLWPLSEILMGEAGILLTDPTQLVKEKIAKLVHTALPDAAEPDRIENALAVTLGVKDVEIDPREMFREIVDAWGQILESFSSEKALAILVEDIHWADKTMLDVLKLLNERLDRPVLFVCTARPSILVSHPEWEQIDRSTSVRLRPLTQEQGAELIGHLLGSSDLKESIVEQILQKAEGNPFYVEEILHRLIDDGLLVPNGEGFRVEGDVELVEIPDTVQGVILARLDLLSVELRRLLQNAAVVGRSFWVGALSDVEGTDLELGLSELEARHLIVKNHLSSMAGELEYSFRHILIRDVAYETLPRKKRSLLHISTATWIEKTSGDRADELSEVLAHHYHRAFEYSKEESHRRRARDLYRKAAANACARFAVSQGISHGWAAVDLSGNSHERASALEQLGDIYFQSFAIDGAWRAYCEALTQMRGDPQEPAAPARLAAKAALIATRWESGLKEAPDPDELQKIIEEGFAQLSDDVGNEDRARLLISQAFMHLNGWADEDDDGGASSAEEALAIARHLDDPDLASAALDALTYWKVPDGLYGTAAKVNKERLALVPRLHDVKEICDAYIVSAWTSAFAGRYRDALDAASACISRATGIDAGSFVLGLVERVQARVMLGEWDEAIADLEQVDSLERSGGKDLPGPYSWKAYAFVAFAHELRQDEDAFLRALDQFRHFDAHENVREREGGGATLRGAALARAFIHRGELDSAIELIDVGPSPVRCAHLEVMCEYVAAAQAWHEAEELIDRCFAEAKRADLDALPCFALRLKGLLNESKDPRTAAGALRGSAEGFSQLGALWEEAYSRLLLARVLDGPESQVEAKRSLHSFEALRAPAEIEAAKALIVD